MTTDYKEIKKGIKRKEMDEMRFHGNLIIAMIVGGLVGYFTHSWVFGVIVFFSLAVIFGRSYFEV